MAINGVALSGTVNFPFPKDRFQINSKFQTFAVKSQIPKSPHPQIPTSSNPHITPSPHHPITPSAHPHIITSGFYFLLPVRPLHQRDGQHERHDADAKSDGVAKLLVDEDADQRRKNGAHAGEEKMRGLIDVGLMVVAKIC